MTNIDVTGRNFLVTVRQSVLDPALALIIAFNSTSYLLYLFNISFELTADQSSTV